MGSPWAHALLEKGATVALSSRPGEKLDTAVNTLREKGFKACALPIDVQKEESVKEAVSWVKKEWKKIDLLVNNAAQMMHRIYPDFMTSPKSFYEIPPDIWRDMIDTNLNGYYLVTRGFCSNDDQSEYGSDCKHLNKPFNNEHVCALWPLQGGIRSPLQHHDFRT